MKGGRRENTFPPMLTISNSKTQSICEIIESFAEVLCYGTPRKWFPGNSVEMLPGVPLSRLWEVTLSFCILYAGPPS